MLPLQGIHHITAIASDPQANIDFYHNLLGQRLIKKTINFDDPGTYHFYFGDESGTPGTILTFFPWRGAVRGRRGNGEVAATAYTVRPESLDFWQNRLSEHGVTPGEQQKRFGSEVLPFQDPDGMIVELIVDEVPADIQLWEKGPVPSEHVLRGFHGATLWVGDAEATADLLTGSMGYTLSGQEGNRYRFQAAGDGRGRTLDLLERPGELYGRLGAGSVHHIAFRTKNDEEQLAYQSALRAEGYNVTPVQDRQYFHSIYYRVPSGVLFEIATDTPGFLIDETVEELGTGLRLPPWLESNRERISRKLPPVETKPVYSTDQAQEEK
ncbi:MAG: ring-cleaving dioxygenase [Candidatus Promineifilaceae bacterium]